MLPYRIETLYQHDPWANWAVFGATIAASLAINFELIPPEVAAQYFVLGGKSTVAFVGHLFNHAGLAHLVGNMVFLWVFGNAVCATIGNLAYPVVYLGLGVFAGMMHLLITGTPGVGASGAIAGVVGLAVACSRVTRVNLLLSLGFMTRTGRVRLWGLALYWTAWDTFGAWLQRDNVAYWAHLAGTTAGLGAGLALLTSGRFQLTEFDHRSLLDYLLQRTPPHQAKPRTEASFARMQAAARAFRAAMEAEALRSEQPESPAKTRLHLRLGTKPDATSTKRPQHLPAATAVSTAVAVTSPSIQLSGGRPLPAIAPGASPHAPTVGPQPAKAWPASLPEGRYFFFDGSVRRGPITRADFLGRLSFAPDSSRWWFWVSGMKDWQPVSALNRDGGAPSPAPAALPVSSTS